MERSLCPRVSRRAIARMLGVVVTLFSSIQSAYAEEARVLRIRRGRSVPVSAPHRLLQAWPVDLRVRVQRELHLVEHQASVVPRQAPDARGAGAMSRARTDSTRTVRRWCFALRRSSIWSRPTLAAPRPAQLRLSGGLASRRSLHCGVAGSRSSCILTQNLRGRARGLRRTEASDLRRGALFASSAWHVLCCTGD